MSFCHKLLFFALALLLLTCLSGCLTTAGLGPQFSKTTTPKSGKALIYVYRQQKALTGANNPGVKVNGKLVVNKLPDRDYFPISVTPGRYTFTPKMFGIYGTTPATVAAKAGRTYFVRLQVELGKVGFENVAKSEAMSYLPSCYLTKPGYVVDSRVMVAGAGTRTAALSSSETKAAPAAMATSKLYVDATPANARIRIMNIKPKFRQGMKLPAGDYKVVVTAVGYAKYLKWIKLGAEETRQLEVTLKHLE